MCIASVQARTPGSVVLHSLNEHHAQSPSQPSSEFFTCRQKETGQQVAANVRGQAPKETQNKKHHPTSVPCCSVPASVHTRFCLLTPRGCSRRPHSTHGAISFGKLPYPSPASARPTRWLSSQQGLAVVALILQHRPHPCAHAGPRGLHLTVCEQPAGPAGQFTAGCSQQGLAVVTLILKVSPGPLVHGFGPVLDAQGMRLLPRCGLLVGRHARRLGGPL